MADAFIYYSLESALRGGLKGDSRCSSMAGITTVQQGLLGENEFWKLVVVGSHGTVEPRRPLPDDERIDFLIHPRGSIEPMLAFQVKTAMNLHRQGKADIFSIRFYVRPNRLVTHPRFWYFLAHFDQRIMTFRTPVFLVPSTYLHPLGFRDKTNRFGFMVKLSLDPASKDRWVPFRSSTGEVGGRIQAILRKFPIESRRERLEWRAVLRTPNAGARQVSPAA